MNKNNKNTRKGKSFYEVVPITYDESALRRNLYILKLLYKKLLSFAGNLIWFAFVFIEILLIARLTLVYIGSQGENLLTFLLYALSYPFVAILYPSVQQLPVESSFVYETALSLFVYLTVFFFVYKFISVLKKLSLKIGGE